MLPVQKKSFALITGATSGFGYEFAKLFAQDHYNLVLVGRSEDRLREIADELSQQFLIDVITINKNLFEPQAAREIYHEVHIRELEVEFLVNNAGQGEWGSFATIDLQRSLDLIQLNIATLVSLTRYFLTDMLLRQRGRILQVGSEAGKTPMPLLSVYAATKAFVVSFGEALSNELKDTPVTVTVLMPGASDTDFFHKAHAERTVTYREERLASAEEVAKDGYEAMMQGQSNVISGMQTRIHVLKSRLMSDENNAEGSRKLMELSDRPNNGRMESDHRPSRASRWSINRSTGKTSGDYPRFKEISGF